MALCIDQHAVNAVTRQNAPLSELDYNTVNVWPVVTRISTFVFDLPESAPSIDLWLTQSSARAVTVSLDDGTTMQSNEVCAEFAHTFSGGGRHTVSVEAADGATWYPGALAGSHIYNFVGIDVADEYNGDDTLQSASFGCGVFADISSGVPWFEGCEGLTAVDFSQSDTDAIVQSAFRDCTALETVVWNSRISAIYPQAFAYTEALTEIHIPETVNRVWGLAFADSGVMRAEIAARTVDAGAFSDCNDLEHIWLRQTVGIVAGSPSVYASEQWMGCNANAGLFCECTTKPSLWGEAYNAYDHRNDVLISNPSYYLKYTSVWRKRIAPWIPVEISGIAVTTLPRKLSYQQGDQLDLSGITVGVLYSDESFADVTDACVFSPANGAILGASGTQTVEISYTKDGETVTTSFDVEVESVTPLVSIAVTALPGKLFYELGEALDTTGIRVMATYENGSTADVTARCTSHVAERADGRLADYGMNLWFMSYSEAGVDTDSDYCVASVVQASSGATTAYFVISSSLAQNLYYTQSDASGVGVDWGDGTEAERKDALSVSTSHTYTYMGGYIVSITADSGVTWGPGATISSTNYGMLGYNAKSDSFPTLTRFDFGEGCELRQYAFDACTSLMSIVIPNGTTAIPQYAFRDATHLSDITLPASVTSVAEYGLSGLSSTVSLHITDLSAYLGIQYHINAYGSLPLPWSRHIYLNGTMLSGRLTVPEDVTQLGVLSCGGLYDFTEILIPSSVETIGDYAFSCCYQLTSMTFPDTVSTAGSSLCYSCYLLPAVEIACHEIGREVFCGDTVEQPKLWIRNTAEVLGGNLIYQSDGIIYCEDTEAQEGWNASFNVGNTSSVTHPVVYGQTICPW